MWTFRFFRDNAGEWRWRLRGANNEIICYGEGHTRFADALRSAERFKAKVGDARIVRPKIARQRRSVAPPQKRMPLLDALVAQSQRRQPR
jgi:uncharacterized protein YegP (UPF0339 family)